MKHDLGLFYRRHDRGIAVGILEHADTKVDLALARVSGVKLAEAKDRIGGNGLEVFEHGAAFHCPGDNSYLGHSAGRWQPVYGVSA